MTNPTPASLPPPATSRAMQPPRKVLVGTVMQRFQGTCAERLNLAVDLVARVAEKAAAQHPDRGLDLVVLPEHAIQEGDSGSAQSRAVPLKGSVLETFAHLARTYRTNLILPVLLNEVAEGHGFSNSAVVLNREGGIMGIYRKVFPVAEFGNPVLEGGVTPGTEFPVFDCDFGRLGIQICWDMSYLEGWEALAEKGAEIVALPSASPQTARPGMFALRGGYYVVSSTPGRNASVINPLGLVESQIRENPGGPSENVLIQLIDLSFAILHWSYPLAHGRIFDGPFGERVDYRYWDHEDAGIFWSNDPTLSIGSAIEQLGLSEMSAQSEWCRRLRDGFVEPIL